MSKHLTSQRYVFKIHSSRLRRAKWNLQLTINQARENKELIALSESQMMRFIDELNGIINPELHISNSYHCIGAHYPSPSGRSSRKYPYPVRDYAYLKNYSYATCYRLFDIKLQSMNGGK